MISDNSYPCRKCGICCTQLNHNPIYEFLNRGDGTCKNFNEEKRICKIYDDRPLLCRIEEGYEKLFSSKYTKEEFYELNIKVCDNLQKVDK